MSILRITNVSPGNLWLRDLYTELSPGETATIKRTPAEMGDMVGLQEYLADGKVVVDIDLEAYESSGELVPVWPLGLNGRPAVPTTVALPLLNNRLGDTRLVIDILQQFAWNGTVWVGIGGGGGGGVTSVTASLPLSSSGGATPAISLGTVGVAKGGTGQTSLTANAVVLGNGALAVQTVAPGTSGNVLTSDGTTWSSAPSSATPPGGGVGDLQINDGVGGFAGSTDLSFGAQTLEVNNTVRVTDGGNTLTVQPTFIGSDAATLTLDAASTVQVGGVAGVSIGGIYTLPAVVGAAGEVLTTDGSGSASWVANSASLTGKMIWVDSVNGNDSTAARGNDGLPFLTVEAALAVALNGDVVMVRPGTYNVATTLTLPTGVALRGYSRENTIIQKLLVTADTTLLTMGASSSIQDLSFKLTSTGHHTLKGVLWPGTTTATAHADHCYIDVDNSTAGDAGTSNVYGVHVTATSTPARITSVASNDVVVNVTSAGLGNKRGILLDTSIAYFRNESCIYSAVRTGAAAGSYIGGEINVLGGILAMNSGGYEGTSADMSETAGSLEVLGVDLTNDNANGKGFLVTQASPRFTWGIIGVVPSAGTRYLYPGTANDSGVEIFTRLAAKGIVKSLIVRSRVAPGVGTDVYTLRKNGVNTALTVSLTGAAVSAQILTASVSFSSSDDLSVSVSSTGGTGADVVIVAEIY